MARKKPDIERYTDKEGRQAYLRAYRQDPANAERRRAYNRARYRDPRWHEQMKRQSAEFAEKKRAALQPIYDEARSQGCSYCPETDTRCLQFHHRDPAMKAFRVGSYLSDLRLGRDPGFVRHAEALRAEIAKCDVVCANCHWKIHDGDMSKRIVSADHFPTKS